MPLKYLLSFGAFCSVLAAFSSSRAEELNIHFKTTPRLELLRPFADPIDLSVLVTGSDGKPLKQGSVSLRLEAPAPGRISSTDFPLVEGTLLNEMRLPLRQGKADWKYLFPIRGMYRLAVEAQSEDGRKAGKIFEITVRENRMKWLALGSFSAGLFFLGFSAGRVFTGGRSERVASIAVALLCLSPVVLAAQPDNKSALEIEPATVGKTSLVRWKPAVEHDVPSLSVMFSLSITHLEKEKTVFAVEKMPVLGEWSMKFHFPDGAEYRVAAAADFPGRAPLRSEQIVSVTGVEPPARAMIPSLVYFAALIALGLAAGRWSKRRGYESDSTH